MRMSVTPSCASTVPSTSSTIEWITDCGWTSTSILAASTPKSQRASITSRPLFMRVAESIVILGPMRQVGCARASSRVMRSKLSRGRLRNGPPEAVRMQPPHVLRPAAVEALVQRAVLAVDGQEPGARLARPGEHQLPGHHQRLLVRERHVLARLERAVGRHEAHGAHRGGDHHVRLGPGGHLDHALAAGHGAQAREVHEAGEPLEGARVGDRHDPRAVPRHLLRQDLDVRPGGEAHDLEAAGKRVHHPQHVRADGARRAEDGEAFHGGLGYVRRLMLTGNWRRRGAIRLVVERSVHVLEVIVQDRRSEQQTVEPVEHAAVAGEERPRVLHAGPALRAGSRRGPPRSPWPPPPPRGRPRAAPARRAGRGGGPRRPRGHRRRGPRSPPRPTCRGR